MARSEYFPRQELDGLLSALCDGRLEDDARQRLEEILGRSREARFRYLAYLDLHLELDDVSERQRMITLPSAHGVAPPVARKGFPTKPLLAAAALLTLCATAYLASREPDGTAPPTVLSEETAAPPVARLRTSLPAEWGGNGAPSGEGLRPRTTYELTAGRVGLRFLCGAEVTLVAPCRFEIAGEKDIRFDFGRIACWIPPSARGFTVSSGRTRLVDIGTRFSANFGSNGRSKLLVTEGQVVASFESQDNAPETTVLITAGGSVRVDPADGSIAEIPYEAGGFAEPLEMEREPLYIPGTYRQAVREASPSAYWTFESGENGVFPDETGSGRYVRAVGNLTTAETAGNRSIVLAAQGEASIAVDGVFEGINDGRGYSIELWFNADRLQHGSLASLFLPEAVEPEVSGPSGQVNPYLAHLDWPVGASPVIDGTARQPFLIRQTHRSPPGITGGTDVFSSLTYSPHTWHYLVAVASASHMAIYLDGREVAWLPFSPPTGPQAAKLVLGDLNLPERHAGQRRTFRGGMDEIAIYPRLLKAKEIAARWSIVAGSPKPLSEK